METEQLRETLEWADLTQYEASAYIALVELGAGSAIDIADTADIPQARIYDVLRGLEREGYIETYQQGTLRARAHDPRKLLDDLQSRVEGVRDATEELRTRWERPTVEDHMVSVVKRFETVLERTRERILDADNEIEAALTPSNIEELRDALETAHENGVVIKITVTPESENDDPLEGLDGFEEFATEVRYRRLPTPFLVLADRMKVCFTPEVTLHPTNEYGVLVNDYSLSRVFDWFFQTALWDYWEVVYSTQDEGLPTVYTNLRECIRDIAPLAKEGHRIVLTVEGRERIGNEERSLTGIVREFSYTGDSEHDTPPLASFVEEATIQLDTEDGLYQIGGWGSLFEDIETRRVVVEAVD
jgi:sugar-specific transcriptional regulator TrmB